MTKKICFVMSIILCFLSTASTVFGQGHSRNITGEFSNIQIQVNNLPLTLYQEPFVYDGEVYVPIKNLSQWLYLKTEHDESKGTIEINTANLLKDTATRNFAGELLQKEYKISVLSQELRETDKKFQEKTKFPYKRISHDHEMETYLQQHFGRLRGIPMTMDFRHYSGNRYRLYITFSHRDRRDFEDLSRRVVEEWLEDILNATRELYDSNARIDGYVRDDASSYRNYVSFETYSNGLDFDFRSHSRTNNNRINIDEGKLEKHLERYLSSYHGVDFDYRVTANHYDIDLLVYFDNKDFYDWSNSRQRSYLDRLQKEIQDFDKRLDAYGRIIDSSKDREVLQFRFIGDGVDFYDYEPRRVVENLQHIEADPPEVHPMVRRNLTAWFHPLQLHVDGEPFTLLKDPFIIGDEIYLPISDLGDALYWIVEYRPEESLLKITDNNFKSKDYRVLGDSLLWERQQEIEDLLTQLEIAKEDIARRDKRSLVYRNISSVSRMQSYLRDHFEDFEGIDMSISFSRSSNNHYRLRITYPRADYSDFDSIRRDTIEAWVEDMFDAVRDLYDPYATISGYIRSSSNSSDYTYITFDTERDRLVFDFEDHGNQRVSSRNVDAKTLERNLDRHMRRFRGANFRYEVTVNRRDVDLNIHCTNDRFYRWDIHDKMDYLQALKEEIFDVYDGINVNGKVFDTGRDNDALRFSFEKGNIRSFDLLKEMESYLNKNYGEFYHGDLNFTYRILEKDENTFDVRLEGDFFKEESTWRNIAGDETRLQDFHSFLENTLNFISEFWQVDVTGEVVDKASSVLVVKSIAY